MTHHRRIACPRCGVEREPRQSLEVARNMLCRDCRWVDRSCFAPPREACGTPAGWERHRHAKELPCLACESAHAAA